MIQPREIPVYLFTGFLESGKTTFIQETLPSMRDRRRCFLCAKRAKSSIHRLSLRPPM